MAAGDADKTEEPTPARRRKAREEGQFPRGKDAGATVGSLAALLTLGFLRDTYVVTFGQLAHHCFGEPYDLLEGDGQRLWLLVVRALLLTVYPLAAAAAVGAISVGLLEAGYQPILGLAMPRWNRIDPLPKFKQMFSPQQALPNIGVQLLRVVVLGAVTFACVRSQFPILMKLGRTDLLGGLGAVVTAVLQLCLWASLALALLAIVDYLRSHQQHEESIRMTRQEVKDEMKQQEGDPKTKQRQRSRAREVARRGLAAAVASSDFVVVNPTHVSVAIRYRVAEGAPLVTAKGYDEYALRIRRLAKEADVPLVENPVLARSLAKRVREGRPIPVDLYGAVAEVLAFVYRLKNRPLEDFGQ